MTDRPADVRARQLVRDRSREFIPEFWVCWRGRGSHAQPISVPFPVRETRVLPWGESAHEPIPARDLR